MTEPRIKLALDVMGGDHAPAVTVEGAVRAVSEAGLDVLLVGDEPRIRAELDRIHAPAPARERFEFVHAPENIPMSEHPSAVLRSRKDCSLAVSARLVKEGRAAGFVSAGNTGAAMAAAIGYVGRIPGVKRPAIAAFLPCGAGKFSIALDMGANVDSKPEHLVQFAVMGSEFAKFLFNIEQPRVAVLSNGEEKGKGNELVKQVHDLLERAPVSFIGNAEGRDLFNGRADVIVCDGFTGNVALKVAESVAEMIIGRLKTGLKKSPARMLGALLAKPAFKEILKDIDYSEYGGAPLLGIDGVAIIAHGRSDSKAVASALKVGERSCRHGVNARIAAQLAKLEPAGSAT